MKLKPIETPDEMMEYFLDHLYEYMRDLKEEMTDRLHDFEPINEFERGQFVGMQRAIEEMRNHIRNLYKHGYEHLSVEYYEAENCRINEDGTCQK